MKIAKKIEKIKIQSTRTEKTLLRSLKSCEISVCVYLSIDFMPNSAHQTTKKWHVDIFSVVRLPICVFILKVLQTKKKDKKSRKEM